MIGKNIEMRSKGNGVTIFAEKAFPLALARDVRLTSAALHVTLADGREVSAPMQWFPSLLHATPKQRAKWESLGDGVIIHWPLVDEDIEVESLWAT